jgi:hypothetical protein
MLRQDAGIMPARSGEPTAGKQASDLMGKVPLFLPLLVIHHPTKKSEDSVA